MVSPGSASPTAQQRLVFLDAHNIKNAGSNTPSHLRRVMENSKFAFAVEHDNPAVSTHAIVKVGNRFRSRLLGRVARSNAIGGPLGEDKLHDGLAQPVVETAAVSLSA